MKRSLIRKYGGILAAMFVPVIVLLLGISIWMFNNEVHSRRMLTQQSEMLTLYQGESVLEHLLRNAVQDLMFLASVEDLRQLIAQPGIDRNNERLALVFKSMIEEKEQFDQIRYLDAEGKEVVRVNSRDGFGIVVSADKLQNKGGRYYFTETMKKERHEIFVSPMDLNMEHGDIELPYKPMIRLATPVFDIAGNRRGIVIINYLADKLISLLGQGGHSSPSHFMLLNKEGYWLKGEKAADEWGFMFPDKKELRIFNRYPDAWKQIADANSGQFTTVNGLFSFSTVSPEQLSGVLGQEKLNTNKQTAGQGVQWKLVSFIPNAVLEMPVYTLGKQYLAVNTVLAIIWGIVALLLSRARIYKIDAQRQLHEKEERISEIVNSAFDAIVTINERGIIETFNPAAREMFGYHGDEIIGQKVNMLMASPDREYHDLHILNFIETGVGRFVGKPGRVTGVKSDGTSVEIEICIGAKQIMDHWLFTAICRQYQEDNDRKM
ncbi:MAG: PAS domain S-box protein [Candidatus Thiodiazotropha endolucinida]